LGSTLLDRFSFGDPVIAGGVIVVILDPGDLVALSRDLSTKLWKKESTTGWTTPRPLVWRDLVLVGNRDGKVFGFRTNNGDAALELTLTGTIRGLGAHEEVLYVGTLNGDLFACRPKMK
jgi:outer membrane protein assembly factor BamB